MRLVRTNEDIWSYADKENLIVVPINNFVRKDGGLAISGKLAKGLEERLPALSSRWGYLVKSGVEMPTYRTSHLSLVGLKDREHYASRPDPQIISDSLHLLNETSMNSPEYVYYLSGYLGGPDYEEMHHQILTSDRIVVLIPEDSDTSHDSVIE